jgi:hypothetical protein
MNSLTKLVSPTHTRTNNHWPFQLYLGKICEITQYYMLGVLDFLDINWLGEYGGII